MESGSWGVNWPLSTCIRGRKLRIGQKKSTPGDDEVEHVLGINFHGRPRGRFESDYRDATLGPDSYKWGAAECLIGRPSNLQAKWSLFVAEAGQP